MMIIIIVYASKLYIKKIYFGYYNPKLNANLAPNKHKCTIEILFSMDAAHGEKLSQNRNCQKLSFIKLYRALSDYSHE